MDLTGQYKILIYTYKTYLDTVIWIISNTDCYVICILKLNIIYLKFKLLLCLILF